MLDFDDFDDFDDDSEVRDYMNKIKLKNSSNLKESENVIKDERVELIVRKKLLEI